VRNLGFYVLDFVLGLITDIELSKKIFTSRTRCIFYLLKHFLFLNLVIFKLKYNNLILIKS
jgi:hypothetical protein